MDTACTPLLVLHNSMDTEDTDVVATQEAGFDFLSGDRRWETTWMWWVALPLEFQRHGS